MKIIARIYTDFPSKFGIPRQSGLVPSLKGRVVFEPEFRDPEALRGLEEFSHIWLLWEFSLSVREKWSPTVRPPRLGGNCRMGVFATRSPFRPNPIGLSCVRLEKVLLRGEDGPTLLVSGADILDGTPVYDIKPYLPFTDSRPTATGGFTERTEHRLDVFIPDELRENIPEEELSTVAEILAQDPRPSYQCDPGRVYGMEYADAEIKFTVDGSKLTVKEIEKRG